MAEWKVPRVQVFSLKGGVGKTTISWLLARRWAEREQKPVLIIDADFTGTCLGDLLRRGISPSWDKTLNVAHLVMGPPESLRELTTGADAPIHAHVSGAKGWQFDPAVSPTGASVLFAPSHESSGTVTVDSVECAGSSRSVLSSLIAHEGAGHWVSHILHALVEGLLARTGQALAGVVIDHSPGMGQFQQHMLQHGDANTRNFLVCSPDCVDLDAVSVYMESADHAGLRVIVNREETPEPDILAGWYTQHVGLTHDPAVATAVRKGTLHTLPIGMFATELDALLSLVAP